MNVPYCACGHAAQIHGADHPGGNLTPDGPRNRGACSANRCWCDEYMERKR